MDQIVVAAIFLMIRQTGTGELPLHIERRPPPLVKVLALIKRLAFNARGITLNDYGWKLYVGLE